MALRLVLRRRPSLSDSDGVLRLQKMALAGSRSCPAAPGPGGDPPVPADHPVTTPPAAPASDPPAVEPPAAPGPGDVPSGLEFIAYLFATIMYLLTRAMILLEALS
ncbi:hypothetical protein ACP70R_044246 [Stipagrostis hirtigluma subsp. patula]